MAKQGSNVDASLLSTPRARPPRKDAAIWNGSTFLALGSLGDGMEIEGQVNAMSVLNGDVYFGGQFGTVDGRVSSGIAYYSPDDIFQNRFE